MAQELLEVLLIEFTIGAEVLYEALNEPLAIGAFYKGVIVELGELKLLHDQVLQFLNKALHKLKIGITLGLHDEYGGVEDAKEGVLGQTLAQALDLEVAAVQVALEQLVLNEIDVFLEKLTGDDVFQVKEGVDQRVAVEDLLLGDPFLPVLLHEEQVQLGHVDVTEKEPEIQPKVLEDGDVDDLLILNLRNEIEQ